MIMTFNLSQIEGCYTIIAGKTTCWQQNQEKFVVVVFFISIVNSLNKFRMYSDVLSINMSGIWRSILG